MVQNNVLAERLRHIVESDVRTSVWLMVVSFAAHDFASGTALRARSMSSGVFRFSNISAVKANRVSSGSVITRVFLGGNSDASLYFPVWSAAVATGKNFRE